LQGNVKSKQTGIWATTFRARAPRSARGARVRGVLGNDYATMKVVIMRDGTEDRRYAYLRCAARNRARKDIRGEV
jgi:hypothetical protein